MRCIALANDSMNRLHCPEHSLVYGEEEIARVQDTLKLNKWTRFTGSVVLKFTWSIQEIWTVFAKLKHSPNSKLCKYFANIL